MSYIIAFVKFPESGKEYPVECFRTDLKALDEVIVRRADDKLKYAVITQLQYLSWDCKARIECLKSESVLESNGVITLPRISPVMKGISTVTALMEVLRERGWIHTRSNQRAYKYVLANFNKSDTCYIYLRKNGVDIQILPSTDIEKPKYGSLDPGTFTKGRTVRHALGHTKFNLLEGIVRFSESFLGNEKNLDRYFVSQGSTDKRTDELKRKSEAEMKQRRSFKRQRNEMIDIYDACSDGSGGPAYLSDGIWISSDGSTSDEGR